MKLNSSVRVNPMCKVKEKKLKIYIYFRKDLKTCNDFVSLHSVERLFHTFAPLYEKLFCPTVDFLKGSLKFMEMVDTRILVTAEVISIYLLTYLAL